jgi:hypothetical protein
MIVVSIAAILAIDCSWLICQTVGRSQPLRVDPLEGVAQHPHQPPPEKIGFVEGAEALLP